MPLIPNTIFGQPSGDVLSGVGAVGGLAGGYLAGLGAEAAAKAQAQGYDANAALVGNQVAGEMFQFGRQRLAQNYRANAITGRQQALYGAGGVTGGGGSPLDVMSDTNNQIKLEAMNLAYAKRFAQRTAAAEGQEDYTAADAARKAGGASMIADLLGGIGNAAKLLPVNSA